MGYRVAGAETTAPICEWMGLWISSYVACMKLFLDLRRFLGRLWPCSGCMLSFTCFSRSRWAVTLLLTAGGAIPARRYMFSTFGWLQASCDGTTNHRSALGQPCVHSDLSHTGHAYSAME